MPRKPKSAPPIWRNATLSAQGQLAVAYFNLRTSDALKALLERTVRDFKRTQEIVNNQYKVGTATRADYITAQTQVLSTEASAINVGVQRAQYEHAIAVLIGRPPAEVTIAPRSWIATNPPAIPVTVPSLLLERRPDIAAAERQLQTLNALIGVAVANFYPDINLSALLSFSGASPLPISAAMEAWSLAGSATPNHFRRRFANRGTRRGACELSARCRELSSDRPHGVPASRGSTRRHPHPVAAGQEGSRGRQGGAPKRSRSI